MRLQESCIGHEQDLHTEGARALHDLDQIWMQHWLAAGQHEIAHSLAVKNVDRFESALALDIVPVLARQLIERESAKAAPCVARIVERELTKARAAFLQNEPQRAVAVSLRQRALARHI